MTDHPDRKTAAIVAAVQQYLNDEARRPAVSQVHLPLSLWKSAKWRTLRDSAYHPTNLWKYSIWQ